MNKQEMEAKIEKELEEFEQEQWRKFEEEEAEKLNPVGPAFNADSALAYCAAQCVSRRPSELSEALSLLLAF